MSLGEFSVTIQAINEASPVFQIIRNDAANLATAISDQPISIKFDPVTLDTEPLQASLNDAGTAATEMGANVKAAATSFSDMKINADDTTVSLRTVTSGIRETAMMGGQLTTLATDFGLIDSQTSKYIRTVLLMVQIVSSAGKMINFMTEMTTGHAAAVAIDTSTETESAGATVASGSALGIKTVITNIATAAQNALNISHATFLALTGVGIAAIIAAAAAIAYFSSQMNNATASVNAYNSAATNTTTHMQSITRAGAQALSRQGIETSG